MPMHYRTGQPSLRVISNTIRNGELMPALHLEGGILAENGFKKGQTIIIYSKKKGELMIKKYKLEIKGGGKE